MSTSRSKSKAAKPAAAPAQGDAFSVFPQALREKVRRAFQHATELLAEGEAVRAHWLIGRLASEGAGVALPTDTDSPDGKALSAHLARQVAAMEQADYIIHVSEAWALPAKDLHRQEEILEKYGAISRYPNRLDVLHISAETHEGMYSLTARISPWPPSKKRRKLGIPEGVRSDHAEGQFTNLLPPPAGKPLH